MYHPECSYCRESSNTEGCAVHAVPLPRPQSFHHVPPATTQPSTGWICPSCKATYAPWVASCLRCPDHVDRADG